MLIGAEQIIGGIPGIHLDPMLLAQSQEGDSRAIIMITHSLPHKTYDLLFLQGATITECARMTADLRFPVDIELVKSTFAVHKGDCSLYLFRCADPELGHFQSTFRSEPCLKVHVNALTRKQIQSLVKATGCRKGILERNIFQDDPPRIELVEVDPTMHLPSFKTGWSQGRLLLYDLEKNAQLNGQAIDRVQQPVPVTQPIRRSRVRITMVSDQEPKDASNTPGAVIADKPSEATPPENTLNDFDAMLQGILSTPLSTYVEVKTNQPLSKRSRKKSPPSSAAPDSSPASTDANMAPQHSDPVASEKPENNIPAGTSASSPPDVGSPDVNSQSVSEEQKYIRLFQRMFRSFRQQAFECFGPRYDTIMSEAEQQVRLLTPEFDLEDFRTDTVPFLLDIVQTMIERASFLKRSKLRSAAQTLVADLYNKHYDLLAQYNAIDKVEQCYYQLKK